MPTCVIKGCKNRPEVVQQNKELTLTFHRFPVAIPQMMKVWLKAIGTVNLKNPNCPIHKTSIICSDHFEAKYFIYTGMRTRLLPTAVPTVFKSSNVQLCESGKKSLISNISILEQDLELASIEDIKKISNIQIPLPAQKKCINIPSTSLMREGKKSLRRILPVEPPKETFVFLRNFSATTTAVEQPQIPAQEMNMIKTAAITMTEESTVMSRKQPFAPVEIDVSVEDQGVVCVVGLDPNCAPAVKVFETVSLAGVRKFENLCRVCLNTTDKMIPIFEDLGDASWDEKIHKHLSIRVTREDRLPLKLCSNCTEVLKNIDELSDKSFDSELKLRLLLDMDDANTSSTQQEKHPADVEVGKKYLQSNQEMGKIFKCPDCNKTSTNYKSFARHCYAVHKKKKCKSCYVLLSNKEEMLQHRIEVHGSSCAACGLKFKGINTMLKHVRTEHPDFKSNTCEICGKSFISKYSLTVHYEIHNSNKPFLCDSCGKNFKSRRKLKHHKCNNENEDEERTVNECLICGKRYTFRSSLKRHLLRHTNNKNFQCHVCCKRFYGAANLKNHMVVHERSTIYECQMCCARYYHKRNMITHLKEKHSTRWHYKCPYCILLFSSIDEVIGHRDETHPCHEESKQEMTVGEQDAGTFEQFKCKICEKRFENIYALTHHFEEHVIHGPEDMNIKTIGVDGLLECALCGANLTSTWAMRCHIKKTHLNLHPKLLGHTCDHCTKQFATKSQLRRHIMQHTGEKPFNCNTCDAGFRSKTAHKIHMRIHTGETPFHCQKCPKKFRSSAILKNHEGVHIRPFSCGQCFQRFSSNAALKSHLDLHEREPLHNFKCQYCDFTSKNRSVLKKHELLSHIELDTVEPMDPSSDPQLVTAIQDQNISGQPSEFVTPDEASYFAL